MKTKPDLKLGLGISVVDVEFSGGDWLISARGRGSRRCPGCNERSNSYHGSYLRRLRDLPIQGALVTLEVPSRRWRCRTRGCTRVTFVEQLPQLAMPLTRRTARVSDLVRLLGHATGGKPAERLLARLGMPVSDDTVLRHLKRHLAIALPPPAIRVAGVDDWGWVKGNIYGTLLVDLERKTVVDILADRSAQSTAAWFKQHPEVEIVSRDRCGLYAQGAKQGAPQARQVADRFHLLQNLKMTIERQLSRTSLFVERPQAREAPDPVFVSSNVVVKTRSVTLTKLAEHRELMKQTRRAAREASFERVKGLLAAGRSFNETVRETGLNWRTIARWNQFDIFPARQLPSKKPGMISEFQGYLSQLWTKGMTKGRHLLHEIKKLGYTGSRASLERLLLIWRSNGKSDPGTSFRLIETPAVEGVQSGQLISPIIAAALCIKPRPLLTLRQAVKVAALKAISPDFVEMRGFAMRFRGIMHSGNLEKFNIWMDEVRHSGIYGMQRFARSLQQDIHAVRNAITEPWSNGQLEGQINRLKMLKRAMYGRANVELLRARMMPL
jgi:transposase